MTWPGLEAYTELILVKENQHNDNLIHRNIEQQYRYKLKLLIKE
jgi:hypothetical protein